MKYYSPDKNLTLATLGESQDWFFSFNNVPTLDAKKNTLELDLPNGTYEGDTKTFILVQNDKKTKVFIKGKLRVPGYDSEENVFLLKDVGQSVSLIWSGKFEMWFISGTGCTVYTKTEYETNDFNDFNDLK